ncbi:MAG TPA: 16S rRNA (guanine(966)-N(2))-methyltransferase RsmD [Candidatus Fusicatenibacter intestinigallinarum]|uniref:16S rRNA (Guanine(966)-N(2))-methyltransferase RsmD n=1 Tax=Candidatus Fusicatenibacter intestinigallinarum TaxID=2838598 RepID=A0A9D2NA29_9FIRM|nr:16S rRNA (guanine(966)-N(2))-methyltransferase RsmD [Candidatus Fusicatenibacter intestinigallinarum]
MRVIAGKCRSLPLKTVPGMNTRPTTDRTKETLFNMLQPYLADCRFLDLFSGSGGIGIEALSRGASYCCFVEQNRQALNCIRENLKFTKLESQAKVIGAEVMQALDRLEGDPVFDCIFMDPPYRRELEKKVLERIRTASFVGRDTLIVVEASLDTDFSYLEEMGYEIIKEKKYKTNGHFFLRRLEGEIEE